MADTDASSAEQTVREYRRLWDDGASVDDAVAESIVVRDPAAPDGEIRGRDRLEAYVSDVRSAFPDFRVEIHDAVEDDGVVMLEWTMRGTHEGEYHGVPPTGREMEVRGMSTVRVADGEVTEDRLYFDRQALHEQLGLVES